MLTLIHFGGPDKAAHAGNWPLYIDNIKETDSLANELWEFIQSTENYKDQTTLFITWDHGRHLDNIASGYLSHGDNCEGCRHIAMLALGPDLKKDEILTSHYGQTDIAPTIAYMLNIPFEGEGQIISELFK